MGKGSASSGALTPLRPVSELLDHLQEVTGGPVDAAVLGRALTHRSYAYEAGGLPHNERLEFLGDSVLGLVVTTTLYDAHPDTSEGQLAKLRAAVVNMRALADVGRTLGLGDYVYLGRGEESTGGRDKDSILADTVEAVIGAVYQSAGIEAAGELVHHLVDPLLAQSATLGAGLDWKTSLQEITSRHALGAPEYSVTEDGPEHAKWFEAQVVVGGEVLGTGSGRTKKVAEQEAAALAWTAIRDAHEGPGRRPRGGAAPGGRRRRSSSRTDPPRAVPELPEVEVVRRGLADHVLGRTVADVELRGHRVARRHVAGPQDLTDRLAGRRIEAVRRRGKYLWLDLGDSLGLILHLGMSGQLLVEDAAAPDEKHLHARFRFADERPRAALRRPAHLRRARPHRPRRARHPGDDRAHRTRPARAGLRPGRGRAPGQGQGQRDQAGAARPDRRLGHRQHLRRRGAVARAGARRAGRERAHQAAHRCRCSTTRPR